MEQASESNTANNSYDERKTEINESIEENECNGGIDDKSSNLETEKEKDNQEADKQADRDKSQLNTNHEELVNLEEMVGTYSSQFDYNNLIGPTAINNLKIPQYSACRSYEETVSPKTGDLMIKTTDVYLPGRNGLDLEIGRVFESNQALVGDRYSDGQGSSMLDQSTYDLYRNALGTGWSFSFPSVEVRGYDANQYIYYHNGKGAVYKVNITPDTSDSNLENYDFKDAKFEHIPGTITLNGLNLNYEYTFTRSDQTKEYFAKEGRILGIKDRFNNQISFKYDYYNVDIDNHVIDTNRAPNYSFEYQDESWGTGNHFYYVTVKYLTPVPQELPGVFSF